jgi:holo-[acyl-carrier protein] synthase
VIYGIGTDLIEIARVKRVLDRYGEKFARRILCEPELRRFHKHRKPVEYLAKRFAAKEAFTKALGTGIHAPANWHGVWVTNLPSGKPVLEFTPRLKEFMDKRGVGGCHLTITDEKDIASAVVILESK